MKIKEKQKAIELRKKGYSMKEITRLLMVSKSSASLWVKDIPLNSQAKKRLLTRIRLGQYNSGEYMKAKTRVLQERLKSEALSEFGRIQLSKVAKKLMCAMLYWCEGAKDHHGGVSFTNSDPHLVRLFIRLLIEGYGVDQKKFVARVHVHEYHNVKKQEKFWQNILHLKSTQFRKAYMKPHTGTRYRDNYPGCISLRYYDSILARKLMFLAQEYTRGHGETVSYLSPKETF